MAVSALHAVERIGMPEARIVLGQVVTFLAEAPKSNRSYMAMEGALADVKDKPLHAIPMHLRNAPHTGLKGLGHGEGYEYPHDYPGAWVDKTYLPDEAELNVPYYEPSDRGYEKKIGERRKSRGS
jgi:putative ATPase